MSRQRAASAVVAAAALAAALLLAAHHPLQPVPAVAATFAWVALSFVYPTAWLLVLPACVSWLDFSPWTGGMLWSEFDLALLGALAGGHAARARHPHAAPWPAPRAHGAAAVLLAVGLWRGLTNLPDLPALPDVTATSDMPWTQAGWFDDAFSPLNAWRVSKAWIALVLFTPLLKDAMQRTDVITRRVGPGMVVAVTVAAVAAMWERATHPGLFDMSEPYRTVALFWEMHVGGAAIDAFLALSIAWVAWALWQARGATSWVMAALLSLMVAYAALTTFSRGVYLAAIVQAVLLGTLVRHPRRDAAFLLMRALMLTVAIGFMVLSAWWAGLTGVLAAWSVLGAAWLWRQRHRWHLPWRQAFAGALVLALVAETVAVFSAGSFMGGRVTRTAQDYGSRLAHWQRGVALLTTPAEWLLGLGAGRLPAHYEAFTMEGARWGQVRWQGPDGGSVELSGPRRAPLHVGSQRLVQRVPPPGSPVQVSFTVATTQGATVQVLLCETHLLYDGACQGAMAQVPPLRAGQTARVTLDLTGPALRRPAAFSLSVLNQGGLARIDDVVLASRGLGGRPQWLHNAGFDEGMAHWLPVARHHFLPWHIDNLALELLIERGLLGLAFGLALGVAALAAGVRAARHGTPQAAFVVASLAGLLCVGLVSSVLDVPRVAWLAGLMTWLALMAPRVSAPERRTPTGTAAPSPAG